MLEPPQLTAFNVEEQQLQFQLTPDDSALHTIYKVNPGHLQTAVSSNCIRALVFFQLSKSHDHRRGSEHRSLFPQFYLALLRLSLLLSVILPTSNSVLKTYLAEVPGELHQANDFTQAHCRPLIDHRYWMSYGSDCFEILHLPFSIQFLQRKRYLAHF